MTLLRRVSHYPRKSVRAQDDSLEPSLIRRVGLRPGRFLVRNPRTNAFDWQIPAEFVAAGDVVAPLQSAVHVALVEDVTPEGNCFVRIWEVPNGLAGTTTLTVDQLRGLRPRPGDALCVYTWLEVPRARADEFGAVNARVRVEALPVHGPTEARRTALQVALDRLARTEPEGGT
jgi:hypothetical protein